jgi:class 3 adenylate cyclase/tetratricopeptide (TPR) repeat protein
LGIAAHCAAILVSALGHHSGIVCALSLPLKVNTPDPGRTTARRQMLTVLFTDLCGSTELCRHLEVEHYAELLEQLRALWHAVAEQHHGLVLRSQGDGAMIVFGHPQAGELDSLHAAEAALQIHAGVAALRPEGWPHALAAHSGIHAGVVLVAPGDLERGRFDLIGDVANTAAKLEQAAAPGQIVASLQALGPNAGMLLLQPLPGGDNVRVLGRSAARRRFDATAQRGLTPLLGRDAPVRRLEAFLRDADGPRCALVTAPAGLGKTRLLAELAQRGWGGITRVLQGSCERTLGAEVMQPFAQILRAGLAQPGLTDAQAAAWQQALAGGKVDSYRELLEEAAAGGPLLLVLDDWQWADDASRRLLQLLRALPAGPRLLLTARPQDDGLPWVADALQLELVPLDAAQTASAVRRWLPAADPFLVQRIHAHSGGVPLYIEELCHSATADTLAQALEPHAAAPGAWMAALVTSRQARLAPDAAALLHAAAVIGKDVPLALLQAVVPVQPQALDQLAQADLLYPDAQQPWLRFKHGITHDAVYQGIGLYERRALHQRVLAALQAGGDADGALVEPLAHHSWGAGLWLPAAEHAERAGDRAAQSFAMDRARQHYRAALRALARVPQPTRAQRLQACTLSAKLGLACIFDPLSLGNDLSPFEQAVATARELEDAQAEAHALYWLAYMHYGLGRFREGRDLARAALRLAEQLGDVPLAAQIEAVLGQILHGSCDYDEALALMQRALAGKRARARPGSGTAIGSAYTLACLGSIHADRGDFGAAQQAFDEALHLLGDSSHPVGNSVRNWYAVALIWQQRWHEAERVALDSVRIGEDTHALLLLAVSRSTLGYARWRASGGADALQLFRDAVGWMIARRGEMFTSLHVGWLVEALVASGRVAEARPLAAHVLRRARRGERLGEGITARAMAREAAARGDGAAQRRWLARAEAAARSRGSAREAALNETLRAELTALAP